MTLIDTHAHIYPDAIAAKAARSIGTFYDMPVGMNGTVRWIPCWRTAQRQEFRAFWCSRWP